MTRRIRPTALWTFLALGSGVFLAAEPAQAQRNTYEDFPYNQGSLFYRYLPPRPRTRTVYRPVVRPNPAPPRAAYTYPQPYTYAPQPNYYYNPQTRSYYYYPTAPVAPRAAAPTYSAQPVYPR
jgi:hypothetical protein